jgi:hypothetical protein
MKQVIFIITLFFGFMVFAQEAVIPGADIPSWIAPIIVFLASLPKVGPILVSVLKYMSIISVVLTAMSSVLIAIQKVLEQLHAVKQLTMVQSLIDGIKKIVPWVAYLSMLNVSRDAQAAAGIPAMIPNVTADGKPAASQAPQA